MLLRTSDSEWRIVASSERRRFSVCARSLGRDEALNVHAKRSPTAVLARDPQGRLVNAKRTLVDRTHLGHRASESGAGSSGTESAFQPIGSLWPPLPTQLGHSMGRARTHPCSRQLRLEHRQLERPGVGGRVRDGVVGPVQGKRRHCPVAEVQQPRREPRPSTPVWRRCHTSTARAP